MLILLLLLLLCCLLVGRLWGWCSALGLPHLSPRTGVVRWGSYTGPPVPPVIGHLIRDWGVGPLPFRREGPSSRSGGLNTLFFSLFRLWRPLGALTPFRRSLLVAVAVKSWPSVAVVVVVTSSSLFVVVVSSLSVAAVFTATLTCSSPAIATIVVVCLLLIVLLWGLCLLLWVLLL